MEGFGRMRRKMQSLVFCVAGSWMESKAHANYMPRMGLETMGSSYVCSRQEYPPCLRECPNVCYAVSLESVYACSLQRCKCQLSSHHFNICEALGCIARRPHSGCSNISDFLRLKMLKLKSMRRCLARSCMACKLVHSNA